MTKATLLIFAKMPQVGRTKTRLGRSIGMVRATSLFRLMTEKTISTAIEARNRVPGLRIVLAVDPPQGLSATCPCWRPGIERIAQSRGDLGERMKNAMRNIPPGPVLIIGMDSPQMESQHLLAAIKALKANDAVFGPAMDGGYWLAGFAQRRDAPNLFSDVRWSSDTTLQDTLKSLPRNYSVAKLEVLRDIDEQEDLDAAGWESLSRSCRQRAKNN